MRIPSRRLGELLVERRVVSRDTVDDLLAREASSGPPLAELLVSERVVSEHDLVAAVAAEPGGRFVDLPDRRSDGRRVGKECVNCVDVGGSRRIKKKKKDD